jgi:hypothetical protein
MSFVAVAASRAGRLRAVSNRSWRCERAALDVRRQAIALPSISLLSLQIDEIDKKVLASALACAGAALADPLMSLVRHSRSRHAAAPELRPCRDC